MKRFWLIGFVFVTAGFSACKREQEPNKILDPLPIKSDITSLPAQVGQGWFLMKRDCMKVLVPVMNRTTLTNSTFPELTGPDAQSRYTFTTSERHYGTATFTIQFKDAGNNTIDPIQMQSSTAIIKSVLITDNGGNSKFTLSENLTLTLDLAGIVDSDKRLTGTSNFSSSNLSLNFAFNGVGAKTTFDGLTDGSASASGTFDGQPTTLNLSFYADHTANGNITWSGISGGLHYTETGTGYIVTNEFRLLLE